MRVAVIGAGIAGLATAWRLTTRGLNTVTVFEREALPFSHSSSRNAAIFRPLESHEDVVQLVALSDQLLGELSTSSLVQRSGLLLTAKQPESLDQLVVVASKNHVPHELLSVQGLVQHYPELADGRSTSALWLPQGGVLDIHRVCEALRARLRENDVKVRLNTDVARIRVERGAVSGVVLSSGDIVECDTVVVAAGAWSQTLGASAGAPLSLTPHRRHLALMLPTTSAKIPPTRPVVWDMETGIYFRPESAGVLACPGDHEPVTAGVPSVSQDALDPLLTGLPDLCPTLTSYALVRPWACLRTTTLNRTMAIGPDPRVGGLYWFAGLGGQGMSAGLGGADVLARLIAGEGATALSQAFRVEQHLAPEIAKARGIKL